MGELSKCIPSLVLTMKSNGCYTTAIHPLTGQNWNRKDVYDNPATNVILFLL